MKFCACEAGERARARALAEDAGRKQQRLAQQFAVAGIPAHFQHFTLESLRERAAGDPGKQEALTTAAVLLADGHVAGRVGMYVYGPYGSGKTGLLTPVLRHHLEHNHTALWIEFYDLVGAVQASYSRDDGADPLDAARRCDVLLLDDVGDAVRNDRATGFAETTDRQRILYQIVNYRHNHVLPLLITSNLTPSQFAQQFGVRTIERVVECCAVVQLGGANLRGAV